jgi:hypothetical protein
MLPVNFKPRPVTLEFFYSSVRHTRKRHAQRLKRPELLDDLEALVGDLCVVEAKEL